MTRYRNNSVLSTLLLTLTLLSLSLAKDTDAQDFVYPFEPNFGDVIIEASDDNVTLEPIPLGFNFTLYGQTYDSFFINNNGNVTFTAPLETYTPFAFPNDQGAVIIGPFFADVDTSGIGSGVVHLNQETPGQIVVTWDRVGYYDARIDKLNSFQLILQDDEIFGFDDGDHIIFAYGNLEWTTGDDSGGVNGLAGAPDATPAVAGFDSGNGTDALQLAGSFTDGILNRANSISTFSSTGGQPGDLTPPDTVITTSDIDGKHFATGEITVEWTGSDDVTNPEDLLFLVRLVDSEPLGQLTLETSRTFTGLSEGEHTVEVRALDQAENPDPTAATITFVVDLTPPQIELVSGLPNDAWTNQTTASFTWRGQDNFSTSEEIEYIFQLDGGDFTAYSPDAKGIDLAELTEGGHALAIRAKDKVANESTLTINFTVDLTPPETEFVSSPDEGATVNSTVTFGWTGVDAANTPDQLQFAYAIDNEPFSAFSAETSHIFTGLSDGTHTVRVKSRDLAGNEDPTPAVRTFNVDATPLPLRAGNQVLSLDGDGDYVEIADRPNSGLDGMSEITIEAWVFPKQVGGGNQIVSKYDSHNTRQFSYAVALPGGVRGFVYDENVNILGGHTGTALPPNDWYHIAFVWNGIDGTSVRAYINGIEEPIEFEFQEEVAQVSDTDIPVLIGATIISSGMTGYFNGLIDEVRIWNVARTQEEIQAAMNSPLAGDEPGLVGYWNFDDGTANDLTPNGNNGELRGDAKIVPPDFVDTPLDTTPPVASFTAVPDENAHLNTTTVTIEWNGTDDKTVSANLRFSYRLDSAGFTGFGPDVFTTFTNLAPGQHRVEVKAQDEAGNISPSIRRTFQIDLTPPETQLVEGPEAGEIVTSPVAIQWSALDNLSTDGDFLFATKLDDADFSEFSAETRITLDPIANGSHTFEVQAADKAGNLDPTPLTLEFIVSEGSSDLQPLVIIAPNQGFSGQPLEISWTVTNADIIQANSPWVDRIYLSEDSTLGDDTVLGNFERSSDLSLADSYTRTESVLLPLGLEGEYWLILETDADNMVDEGVAETNNILVADTPTSIVIPPTPDLQVTAIAISGDPWSGRQILVDWTVENQGDADATGSWVDSIYLSADDRVGDDVQLGTFGREGDVPIGASYTLSRPVLLPHGIEGDHWLVVVTNESELLYEAGATDNNAKVSDVSIPVQMLPAPDLQVSTVEIPNTAVGGGDLSVSWTVTNLGTGATDVPFWYDQAYLSSDDVLDGNDTVLGRVFNASYLQPDGESYGQEAEFSMSPETAGVFYVIVQTDSRNSLSEYNSTEEAEDNNWSISTSQIRIELMPTPDLQITQVDVSAAEPRSGLTIDVTWEAVNRGELQIEGQTWTDRIYLSTDDLFSNDDLILDTFTQNSPFEVNTLSTRTQTVTLPLERFGEHHIIVVTDTGNQIFELFREDNNSAVSSALNIRLSPPGDLQVDSVETVAIASAGDEVVVSWTVINNGGGDTNRNSWTDSVYFSQDETLEIGTDTFLRRFTHTGTLAAGETYRGDRTVRLPRAVSGDYHLIVLTDSRSDVFEFQWEDNNTNNTLPVQVQIANLQITQATAPESGAAGNFVLLEWTVKNVGEGTTDASSWRDTIYLSQDETLDTTSDNTLLATYDHVTRLASGEEVVNAQNVVLPKGLDGEFFLFIQADSNGAVFESDETDNLRSALTSIDGEEPVVFDVRLENEPDLLPVSVRRPKRATAGQSVLLSWTIANEGIHSTGALPWQDAIYLSIDRTLDASDILLGTFLVDVPDIPVEPQAMYNRAESLRIPLGTEAGKYFVLVHTDLNNDVEELNAEGNNVKSSGSAISIKPNNPDDPDALIATPDLLVTKVNAPPTGSAGKPLELSWVVTNVGNVPNVVSRWVDAVYLSSDNELSLDTDTRLGGFIHYGSLNPEESYTPTVTVTIPQGISGEHALFIVTDAENDEFEFGREENNLDTAPTMLLIDLAPTDLQVMDVVLPETGMSGQEIEISWTVENRGTGDTNSSRWYDNIYFSRDTFIDDTDVKLGFSLRNAPLPPNESYSSTTPIQLPKGFAGPAYIIITTDANNQVYEHDSEDNNTTVSPQIQVMLTPPTDLVVSKIELPQVAVSGQSAEIRWTVTNQGDVDAPGRWFDSVFLSTDAVWDIDDAFVDDVQNPAPLAPNASYTGSINTTLPGVLPGDYFVIIRTDIRDQVSEVDNLNNDTASGDLLPIEVAELTLSEATQSQLSTGTEHYYKVSVPAGEDLLITLDSVSELSTNELYVRYQAIPSVREHDFRFDALFQADQQITVRFNLRDIPTDSYSLVVVQDGATVTTEFPIVPGDEPDVEFIGLSPDAVRLGATGNYRVIVRNVSNINIDYMSYSVAVEPGRGQKIASPNPKRFGDTLGPIRFDTPYATDEFEGVNLLFRHLPPGSTTTFNILISTTPVFQSVSADRIVQPRTIEWIQSLSLMTTEQFVGFNRTVAELT